jgi:hypothetical protein
MDAPVPDAVSRAASLLRKTPTSWRRAAGGYTPAERWVVRFAGDSSCFAKAATNSLTAGWLRDEYRHVYSQMEAPFLPRVLGWSDDELPLLVLEDLSGARWPPPWSREDVHAVLGTLAHVRSLHLPGLPSSTSLGELEAGTWSSLSLHPAAFLALGLCSEAWLRAALPSLIEGEAVAKEQMLVGGDTLHLDVRSDNLCFVNGRVVLVDWNWVAYGNGEVDIAFWLPSLHSEGGPAPEEILPDAPHWAAAVSGFFASRAGLPFIPNAPRVREVQLSQLKSALPWAQRALRLPPLDGVGN